MDLRSENAAVSTLQFLLQAQFYLSTVYPINSFQEVPISLKMMTDGEEELLKRIYRAVVK